MSVMIGVRKLLFVVFERYKEEYAVYIYYKRGFMRNKRYVIWRKANKLNKIGWTTKKNKKS